MKKRLIVIGGVAAGMSAAAKARRVDPNLEVIVFEQSPHISYAACGMPYWLAGDIADANELIVRTPTQMAKQGVTVHIRHQVTGIDPDVQTVQVRDLVQGTESIQAFDRLIIATGARATRPDIPGNDLDGALTLRSLETGLAVQNYLSKACAKRIVIVGGGYIGVEMAETFVRLGLDVTMVIRSGQVLRSTLDDDVRQLLEAELERNRVRIVQGTPVAFSGQDRVTSVEIEDEQLPCDGVLLGMGATPNVELARDAGVSLGPTGAIATSTSMETNKAGIWAAGDCTEAFHIVTGQPAYIPLGSTANKQGRIAGTNAAGGSQLFGGIVGTMVVRAFDLTVAATGLTASAAKKQGLSVNETLIQAKHISHYFPGAEDIHVKLVDDKETGRLLGGQIVGRQAVAKRIDILATALHNKMTVSDLQNLDLSYAPPFAPVWDPILVAANVAAK